MLAPLKRWQEEPLWNKLMLSLGGLVFVLAVWAFAELADEAVPGRYLALEGKILKAFRHPEDLSKGLGPPIVTDMVRDLTALGSVAVLTLVSALSVGFLLLRRRYGAVALILTATLTGTAFGDMAKSRLARDRPQIVPHLANEASKSFPSGHSMMSSVVYLTLGTLLAQTMARRREKFYIVAAAGLLTVLVGVSRVYLGVHYPTDVLAGWAAGVAWALLFWGIAWGLQRTGQLGSPES